MSVTLDDVRRAALAMPGAYEQASFGGQPSWRTPPRMFTWVRTNPEALVVWVSSPDEVAALVAADPRTFFTTPHYDGTPIVLVRMDVVGTEEMTELVTDSWRLRAPRSLGGDA